MVATQSIFMPNIMNIYPFGATLAQFSLVVLLKTVEQPKKFADLHGKVYGTVCTNDEYDAKVKMPSGLYKQNNTKTMPD